MDKPDEKEIERRKNRQAKDEYFTVGYIDNQGVMTFFQGQAYYETVDEAKKAAKGALVSKHSMNVFVLRCVPIQEQRLDHIERDIS